MVLVCFDVPIFDMEQLLSSCKLIYLHRCHCKYVMHHIFVPKISNDDNVLIVL